MLQALRVELAEPALLLDSVEELDLVGSLQEDWQVVVGYLAPLAPRTA